MFRWFSWNSDKCQGSYGQTINSLSANIMKSWHPRTQSDKCYESIDLIKIRKLKEYSTGWN